MVDMSGTPDVALYFALLKAVPGDIAVVYALNAECVGEDAPFTVAEHGFLVLPHDQGGCQHRWLRQDGFGVCPKDWLNLENVRAFDLERYDCLHACTFVVRAGDRALVEPLGDLEDATNDPLPRRFRGVLDAYLQHLGVPVPPALRVKLDAMAPSPVASLLAEIDSAIVVATGKGKADVVAELARLRVTATGVHWDTSHDCSLDALKARI
jgi:hypothetical protein